jgi:hypothetical protein
MTVEPGFGGQAFLDMALPKVRRARELIADRELDVWLQVDGGVSMRTIERCAEAGADVFVAGSAVYGSKDPAHAGRPCAAARSGRPRRIMAHTGAGDERPTKSRALAASVTSVWASPERSVAAMALDLERPPTTARRVRRGPRSRCGQGRRPRPCPGCEPPCAAEPELVGDLGLEPSLEAIVPGDGRRLQQLNRSHRLR